MFLAVWVFQQQEYYSKLSTTYFLINVVAASDQPIRFPALVTIITVKLWSLPTVSDLIQSICDVLRGSSDSNVKVSVLGEAWAESPAA